MAKAKDSEETKAAPVMTVEDSTEDTKPVAVPVKTTTLPDGVVIEDY